MFRVLDSTLYEIDYENTPTLIKPLESPARFNITFPDIVFSNWKAFLVECASAATVLFKRSNEIAASTFNLEVGEFDSVIREAYDALEALYDREAEARGEPKFSDRA